MRCSRLQIPGDTACAPSISETARPMIPRVCLFNMEYQDFSQNHYTRAGLNAAVAPLWEERARALQQTREETETIRLEVLPVNRVAAVEPQRATAFGQQDDEIDSLRREFYHNRSEFSSAADDGGPKREIGPNEEIYRRLTAGRNDEAGQQLVFSAPPITNTPSQGSRRKREMRKKHPALPGSTPAPLALAP